MGRLRKYNVNDVLFTDIKSEVQAYVLGFITADGSIDNKGPSLKIKLSRKDREHLLKLRNIFESTSPIHDYNYYKDISSTLIISNKKLVKDLEKYNIFSNKTFVVEFPILPDHLIRHYIRGVFDGDGCWSDSHSNPYFSITSASIKFLLSLQLYINEKVKLTSLKLDCKYKRIRSTGFKNCTNLYEFLYKDAKIYLDRKKIKIERLLFKND